VEAGLHPRTSETTVSIAEDLAQRMDFDSGQVRYCLEGMVARLGLSRATVSRHVAYLRELGALVWVERGSRANVRRAQGLGGYAAMATVYGAVIPGVYDRAHGHTVIGDGYTARIVIDQRGQIPAPRRAVEPVDNSAADNGSSAALETPSRTQVKDVGEVQIVGDKDSSTAARAAARFPSRRKKRKVTVLGYKITSERIEEARRLAVCVRPQVNWLQGARHDQLSWVMLDMVAMGWSEPKIVLWLNQLGHEAGTRRWRPRFPHRVIAAALLRQDAKETRQSELQGPDYQQDLRRAVAPNSAFQQARLAISGRREPVVEYLGLHEAAEETHERALLRNKAKADAGLVRSFFRHCGRQAAIRVYGLEAIAALDAAVERERAGFGSTLSAPDS
jgi:hypothetical protein